MIIEVNNVNKMIALGSVIGSLLCGGEVIELIGDIGSGKTTLVKGVASGLNINEYIHSPSFTINRSYKTRNNLVLSHYDFYRIGKPGIMINELKDEINQSDIVIIIEWADSVNNILPKDRLSIHMKTTGDNSRELTFVSNGKISSNLKKRIKNDYPA